MPNPEQSADQQPPERPKRKDVSEMTRIEREHIAPIRQFTDEEKALDEHLKPKAYDPELPPEFQGDKRLTDDHLEFRAAAPYMGIEDVGSITIQEEKMIHLMVSGMSTVAAGRAVGMTKRSSIKKALEKPAIKQALAHYTNLFREEINFGVSNAHTMYMEAYHASASSTEMKNATDSLCKLHGINKEKPANIGPTIVQMNNSVNVTTKQLENMSDRDLLEILDRDPDALKPTSGHALQQENQRIAADYKQKQDEKYPYDVIEHTDTSDIDVKGAHKESTLNIPDVDDDHIERFDG